MKIQFQSVGAAMALLALPLGAFAQGTAFTYQGRLFAQGAPANGSYDLTFALFDSALGGSQVGLTLTNPSVAVNAGLFTVTLDYGGNQFSGPARWLEIGVKTNGGGAFVTLNPRQPLTPTPYAILAASALTASSAESVPAGSVTAAEIAGNQVVKSLNGLEDLVTLAAGNNIGLATNGNTLTISSTAGGGGGGGGSTNGWLLTGNANTVPGTNFVGTTDPAPLELRVNNLRALRLESASGFPNVIGGSSANSVAMGIGGVAIAGGDSNTANADDSSIGGGANNFIKFGSAFAAIAGGERNTIDFAADHSFIGSGQSNNMYQASYSVIGGGQANVILAGDNFSAIAGGQANQINSTFGSIPGGRRNSIGPGSLACVIGGGESNLVQGTFSDHVTIAGGLQNLVEAHGFFATIGGGAANEIQGVNLSEPTFERGYSTISGGEQNLIETNSPNSTIAGGRQNQIGPQAAYATISGGSSNQINAVTLADPYSLSTIGGGGGNFIGTNCYDSTIAGGVNNQVVIVPTGGKASTIGGGSGNYVRAGGGTIAGGTGNQIGGGGSTIAGGGGNTASGLANTIGGGAGNLIDTNDDYSTIAGGNNNSISGSGAQYGCIVGGNGNQITSAVGGTISGGTFNTVSGNFGTVCGGSGNIASGAGATVLGGIGNTAKGSYSIAAGSASVPHDHSFVWGDSGGAISTGPNQFVIQASGGVSINTTSAAPIALNVRGGIQSDTVIATSSMITPSLNVNAISPSSGNQLQLTAATVAVGGALTVSGNVTAGGQICGQMCQTSDRNLKENFHTVDNRDVLAKVVAMPVTEWNFKTDASTRHIGPMAQDFFAAFTVGSDDKHIAVVDEGGVALAAIQGLNQKVEEQRAELKAKDFRIEALENSVGELKKMVSQLVAKDK